MPPRVTLKVTRGPLEGRIFAFETHDTFLFGRSPECHAELSAGDATASRHHFLLEVNPPAARLRDLGSLNGTHVNGVRHGGRNAHESPEDAAQRRWPEVDLHDGDRIRVGATVFDVSIEKGDSNMPREAGGPPPPAPPQRRANSPALEIPGYRIDKLLGRGGMGVVYAAVRLSDGERVAIKALLTQSAVSDSARETFLREIEVTRSLRHANIVTLCDHGSSDRTFYFVMEYCAGGSVNERVSREPLAWRDAVALGLEALEGLAHAHQNGFVHRDLKPENLLLTDRTAGPVKISDFGLAKSFQQAGFSGMTATGAVAGTLSFMPREQLTQFRLMKPASDVWSLGATLYYMLTRQFVRDFRRGVDPLQVILRGGIIPIRSRDPRLPAHVAEVVDRATADAIDDRYPSAVEFRDALRRTL